MNDLLAKQWQLQSEADDIVGLLSLDQLLERVGRPIRVGSSAMGLMVRRDIDITVVCEKIDNATMKAFADVGAELMLRSDCVVAVKFQNDTGRWNTDPEQYPDGLYLWVMVCTPEKVEWTVDIWLVDQPGRQPDLAHLRTLLPRLSEADRLDILRVKQGLVTGNETKVPSALVYEAVMDHDVRTPQDFARWYDERHP